MTVLSFERFTTAPDAGERFAARVATHLEDLRRAPGALWADLAGVDGGYLLLSEWRSAAELDAFQAGNAAENFAGDVDVYLIGEATRRRFEGVP